MPAACRSLFPRQGLALVPSALAALAALGAACGGSVVTGGIDGGESTRYDASAGGLCGGTDGGADVSSIEDGALQTPMAPTDDTGASLDAKGEQNAVDGYQQWWSPECPGSGGQCTDPTCSPITLQVSPSACGTYGTVTVGCLPAGLVTGGWGCWVRLSDHEIIFTPVLPPSTAGLETCVEAGLASAVGGGPEQVFFRLCMDQ